MKSLLQLLSLRRQPPEGKALSSYDRLVEAMSSPLKILIVEPSANQREIVTDFFRQFNIEVTEAADISEAIHRARANPPHFVLLNMCLPLPSDGVTVIRELKRLFPAMPLVAYAPDLNGDVGEALRSVASEGVTPISSSIVTDQSGLHRLLAMFSLARRAGMEPGWTWGQ
jgi:CheY-like chemotaxis protein